MIDYNVNLDQKDLFYINENGLVCCEKWMDVLNYEGIYVVSNLGRRKNKKGKICRRRIKKDYNTARLSKKGVYKEALTHRLVALAFIPNTKNKPEVNHKDGNKWNNVIWNLEWATKSENGKHAYDNKLSKPRLGEKNNFTKLTKEQVLQIREIYSLGFLFQWQIAEIYNIKQATVSGIVTKRRWKYL